LVPLILSKGFKVIVYDLFKHGSETLFSCSFSANLTLIKGDVRNEQDLAKAMQNADAIIHLAALVGFPICSECINFFLLKFFFIY